MKAKAGKKQKVPGDWVEILPGLYRAGDPRASGYLLDEQEIKEVILPRFQKLLLEARRQNANQPSSTGG